MTNYFNNSKENFDLQQRHAMESPTLSSSKNFFFNQIVNIFMFISIISLNNNNNISHLPILQTQTYKDNNSKLDIT